MSEQIHVIVGAGATGTATARFLASKGHRVRLLNRSGTGPEIEHVERLAVDATDSAELARVAAGASAIYNCANPAYHRWTQDWPPLAASILKAAETTDAVLVTLSNLYAYAPPTSPIKPSDPLTPSGPKGEVRKAMWETALDAHNTNRVRVTEARSSDFIGPGLGKNGVMGDRAMIPLLRGKTVSLLGNPDTAHTWTAIDDVAKTLATIGTDARAWGKPWHVPSAPPLSHRQLLTQVSELAGGKPPRIRTIPKMVLRIGGVVNPTMRELSEVLYQHEKPFVMDSTDTTAMFGLTHTPLPETLTKTIEHYQDKTS